MWGAGKRVEGTVEVGWVEQRCSGGDGVLAEVLGDEAEGRGDGAPEGGVGGFAGCDAEMGVAEGVEGKLFELRDTEEVDVGQQQAEAGEGCSGGEMGWAEPGWVKPAPGTGGGLLFVEMGNCAEGSPVSGQRAGRPKAGSVEKRGRRKETAQGRRTRGC